MSNTNFEEGREVLAEETTPEVAFDFAEENVAEEEEVELQVSETDEAGLLKAFHTLSSGEVEDLFNKNTESFRCLAQVLLSCSSIFRQILYHFPPLEDPGIDEAFDYVEPEVNYDDIGCEKYKNMCKDANIVPITRVLKSLPTKTLNLKYYGLTFNQIKAICTTLMLNSHVETLILQDNWISPEGALWLGEMLRENNSIKVLDLRECRLHTEGIKNIIEGISLNQSLRELDLSFNSLGDEGLEELVAALKENQEIQKLNLSHNNLGDIAGIALGKYLEENVTLDYLDLSWNDFYTAPGMKNLCAGLTNNRSVKYLNLAWNAIGTPGVVGPIVKYLKNTEVLEHLDLSNNRLMGDLFKTIRSGITKNTSLVSINLGFNLITPDDALYLINAFNTANLKLEYMDLENVFVQKKFLPVWKKLTQKGKNIRIQGVINDFVLSKPNREKLIFERCKFLAQKPKKKKKKRDFGHFIYSLPDTGVEKKELQKMIKKFKMKFDIDLVQLLATTFTKKGKVSLPFMKETYLKLYPDTEPPPPKKKKAKGKKGKKGKTKTEDEPTVAPEEVKETIDVVDQKLSSKQLITQDDTIATARKSLGAQTKSKIVVVPDVAQTQREDENRHRPRKSSHRKSTHTSMVDPDIKIMENVTEQQSKEDLVVNKALASHEELTETNNQLGE